MKRGAILLLFLVTLFPLAEVSGQDPQIPQPRVDPQLSPQREPTPSLSRDQAEQLKKQRKAQREKQLKEDTDKLLQLATELKASVDKTNANILSLDVVKKSEQIEKLAKHIKSNMRDEMQ